ncbi:hypothetical protein DY000_02040838 [Brassica cretica]|uniref:Uncharacterized protein n=1 Tax=Brassica cretica TaxID=69181 RepID=A0ABQ7BHQ5_BRACR|nr:hypothetical protein DY000_02040838 [Brassica cretica]
MRSPSCCNEPPADNSVLENLEACCLSSLSRLSSNRHHASSTKSTRHTSPLEVITVCATEGANGRRSRVTIEAVWLFVACPLFPYLQICYDIDP